MMDTIDRIKKVIFDTQYSKSLEELGYAAWELEDLVATAIENDIKLFLVPSPSPIKENYYEIGNNRLKVTKSLW